MLYLVSIDWLAVLTNSRRLDVGPWMSVVCVLLMADARATVRRAGRPDVFVVLRPDARPSPCPRSRGHMIEGMGE